jgi:Fe2+ transport system protein FeoA
METNDRWVEKQQAAKVCTLADLRRGLCAKIKALHGDSDSVTRLHALGFLPGRSVRHRNTAPLGDPVAFEINGQKISMRHSEARLVEIEISES